MEMEAARTPDAPRAVGLPAAAFVGTTIAIGALVCSYAAWDLLRSPLSLEWLILLVLTALAGWATLRVPAMPISFSISDTFTIVATLLVGPSAGALTAALDGLVLSFRMANDRRAMHRVLFNMACLAIATWVAGRVYFALAGPATAIEGPASAIRLLLLMTIFGAIHFGLNSGIVAVAIGLARRAPVVPIWREHFSGLWVSSLGGIFAAMLMIVLSRTRTLEVLIVIAPLPVILYFTLRHALGRAEDQITHLGKMNRVYVATIEALAQAVDAKDQVTHAHIRRVQDNSLKLAHALGVRDEGQVQAIKAASLLHDIGKIAIPEHILNKPGRLSAPEFDIMKRHAAIGADILAVIGFPYPLVPIVRHHHENWNGTGYPDGVAGDAIPIGARILQVVDCFDALTSDRPYRPAMTDEDALKIISDRSGTMYDPKVVTALLELHASASGCVPAAVSPEERPAPPALSRIEPARERLPLESFADLGAALASPQSAARVGEAIWTHLRAHVPASAFVLFVYDCATDALVPAYRAGEPTVAAQTVIPLGDRLSGWVAATRRTIRNSDARLDLDADIRPVTALRSTLAVPVSRDANTLGVIAFYSSTPELYEETHQEIAEAAAVVAASALHAAASNAAASHMVAVAS